MKFKTKIEIITDANNRHEAADVAGEYLAGNISTGVTMKCNTAPVVHIRKSFIAIGAISLLAVFGLIQFYAVRATNTVIPEPSSSFSAVQVPLKTSSNHLQNDEFKDEWRDMQNKEALESISK